MTNHITDEQIDEATKDIGLQSPFARYRIARAVLALVSPHGEPAISTKHGPWIKSEYDENETYCQRCKTRSIFASNRQCDPHIVYAAPAPQAGPAAEFNDPRVKMVYELLCGEEPPPPGQHWEGWVSRRIVDALAVTPESAAAPAVPPWPESISIADIDASMRSGSDNPDLRSAIDRATVAECNLLQMKAYARELRGMLAAALALAAPAPAVPSDPTQQVRPYEPTEPMRWVMKRI